MKPMQSLFTSFKISSIVCSAWYLSSRGNNSSCRECDDRWKVIVISTCKSDLIATQNIYDILVCFLVGHRNCHRFCCLLGRLPFLQQQRHGPYLEILHSCRRWTWKIFRKVHPHAMPWRHWIICKIKKQEQQQQQQQQTNPWRSLHKTRQN